MTIATDDVTVRRILKVNHAGEYGAIRIYGAQIAIARRIFPQIVGSLSAMQADEVEHCRLFREAMPQRQARPCRIMRLWSLCGFVLGAVTALCGERMVWVCTEAVESTVHRHLEEQLRFLAGRDPALHHLIESIREEELAHLTEATERQLSDAPLKAFAVRLISTLTEALIWLSTWGDSTRMRRELNGIA